MRRTASIPPELAGFEHQRLLGAGGFSDVFLYRQRLPRRPVAVKVLLVEESTAASQRAFVDEANSMAQLSAHPYIVTIYGADITADGRPYFVMEYCSGPSLAEQYKRAPFSVPDALRIGIRLSSAIATAHRAGILHRDIKPANVLTNDYGWPALTDFGISSTVDDVPVATTTASAIRRATESDTAATGGAAGGTESQSIGMSVPWSPPEMFADDPDPDVRSDVFSLAATIWTLLAGRSPFEVPGRSNGTLDLVGRIERGAVTALGRDDVPRSLVAVLQRGMATRRTDRYATAVEFARALQRVELELGYAVTPIEVPTLPGLDDTAPDARSGGTDADETRVRGVATVVAQPARPALEHPPGDPDPTRIRGVAAVTAQRPASRTATTPAAPAAVVDEGTVLRPRAVAVAEPETTTDRGEEALDGRRIRPITVIAIAAGALVLAVVLVAVLVSGGLASPDPNPSPTPSGSSALDGVVPSPKLVAVTPGPDGTTVTFTFSPVAGAEGYRWAPGEQSDATTGIPTPSVTRTGVTPGTRTCIRIVAVRAGRTSLPTEACYPPS